MSARAERLTGRAILQIQETKIRPEKHLPPETMMM